MEEPVRLMGVGEACRCLGVSYQRLYVLRRRMGFPAPVAELECGVIWLAQDIERYEAVRRKTPGRASRKERET